MLLDLVFAFFIALVFSIIFGMALGRRGPWPNFWLYFFILFLAVWAGGIWMTPAGPTAWGVSWLPFVFIALLVALLFAAITPEPVTRTPAEAVAEAEKESAAMAAVGIFFWILVLVFLVTIVLWYI